MGELDSAEALKLLAELGALGVRRLVLSGGEFCMRSDWQPLLRRALQGFEAVAVLTNGWSGAELVDAVIAFPGRERLTLLVSVDGPRESHDARRGAGSHARAVALLGAVQPVAREVITTVARSNLDQIPAVFEQLVKLRVPGWSVQPALPLGRMRPDHTLSTSEIGQLVGFLDEAQQRAGAHLRISAPGWLHYLAPSPRAGMWEACPARRGQLAILPNGDVTACHIQPDRIWGSARQHSLQELWRDNATQHGCGCSTGTCRVADLLRGAR